MASNSSAPDTVVVGRIGRPHGVRGEATIEVRTDDPDLRFAPGSVLRTEPPGRGPLTVAGARWHREVLLLRVTGPDGAEVDSREAAETLRDTELHVPVDELGIGPDRPYEVQDLLTGARYTWRGARNYVRLDPSYEPGHVLRLVR